MRIFTLFSSIRPPLLSVLRTMVTTIATMLVLIMWMRAMGATLGDALTSNAAATAGTRRRRHHLGSGWRGKEKVLFFLLMKNGDRTLANHIAENANFHSTISSNVQLSMEISRRKIPNPKITSNCFFSPAKQICAKVFLSSTENSSRLLVASFSVSDTCRAADGSKQLLL